MLTYNSLRQLRDTANLELKNKLAQREDVGIKEDGSFI